MTPIPPKSENGNQPLTEHDLEGAVRVFQSLEKLVARPRFVDSLHGQPNQLVTLAKRIREARERRKTFLEPQIFGEPGWDILLSLYIAAREGYQTNGSWVCSESGVPDTTALRWMESLRALGLVQKRPNPLDARAVFVELTADGLEKVERLMQSLWQDYFPFE